MIKPAEFPEGGSHRVATIDLTPLSVEDDEERQRENFQLHQVLVGQASGHPKPCYIRQRIFLQGTSPGYRVGVKAYVCYGSSRRVRKFLREALYGVEIFFSVREATVPEKEERGSGVADAQSV